MNVVYPPPPTDCSYILWKKIKVSGKFGRARKSQTVRYFIVPQCGAVWYKVLVMATRFFVQYKDVWQSDT